MNFNTIGIYTIGNAPIKNALCQPVCGMKKYDTKAAASQPKPQKLSSNTMKRPRTFGGAYSLTKDTATGSCPPSPTPTKKRKNKSADRLGANAHKPVATLYTAIVPAKTVFLPKRSANQPLITAPSAMPTKEMLTIQPNCAGASDQSLPSSGRMNDTSPVSIASNSQPMPTSTKSL